MNISYLKKLLSNSKRIYTDFPTWCKKALVLAPHPDDETLGCGGTILKLKSAGYEITVVLFTYNLKEKRGIEFQQATESLGCSSNIFLECIDGGIKNDCENIKNELQKIVSQIKPDIIFTPYAMDINADHNEISKMLADIFIENGILIFMYEVWTPILYPNYYIDITDFFDQKCIAISKYLSQEIQYNLLKRCVSLNRLRSELFMKNNCKYRESFKVFQYKEYKQIIKLLRDYSLI